MDASGVKTLRHVVQLVQDQLQTHAMFGVEQLLLLVMIVMQNQDVLGVLNRILALIHPHLLVWLLTLVLIVPETHFVTPAWIVKDVNGVKIRVVKQEEPIVSLLTTVLLFVQV